VKNRSRTEIEYSILNAANGEANITEIAYKSFLSYMQVRDYLPAMVENGLLRYENVKMKRRFRTTEKGLQLLKMHEEMHETINWKVGIRQRARRKNDR
jgi:predicted transcriptional regulator